MTVKRPHDDTIEPRGDFAIGWLDRGHPPENAPNPAYPKGCDLDLSEGQVPTCIAALPYPSGHANVGTWMVHCLKCGLTIGLTAASRPNDARLVNLACKDEGE